MMEKRKFSDFELMNALAVDSKTLARFKQIQKETIAEAKKLGAKKGKKIRVLGISGSARDEFDMAQEKSNSEELLEKCLQECKKLGAETELIQLRKYNIQHCKACYSTTNTQCHFYCSCYPKGKNGDDMTNKLYDKILAADAIIFATPVNNFAMSTLMKTFLDRCISLDGSIQPADSKNPKNRELNIKHMKFIELAADDKIPGSGMLKRFFGKVGGIIAVGHESGASLAISSLYMTLTHFGMMFPPFSNMYAHSSECVSTYNDKSEVVDKCHKDETRYLAENVLNAVKIRRDSKFKPTGWVYDYSKN